MSSADTARRYPELRTFEESLGSKAEDLFGFHVANDFQLDTPLVLPELLPIRREQLARIQHQPIQREHTLYTPRQTDLPPAARILAQANDVLPNYMSEHQGNRLRPIGEFVIHRPNGKLLSQIAEEAEFPKKNLRMRYVIETPEAYIVPLDVIPFWSFSKEQMKEQKRLERILQAELRNEQSRMRANHDDDDDDEAKTRRNRLLAVLAVGGVAALAVGLWLGSGPAGIGAGITTLLGGGAAVAPVAVAVDPIYIRVKPEYADIFPNVETVNRNEMIALTQGLHALAEKDTSQWLQAILEEDEIPDAPERYKKMVHQTLQFSIQNSAIVRSWGMSRWEVPDHIDPNLLYSDPDVTPAFYGTYTLTHTTEHLIDVAARTKLIRPGRDGLVEPSEEYVQYVTDAVALT